MFMFDFNSFKLLLLDLMDFDLIGLMYFHVFYSFLIYKLLAFDAGVRVSI